MKEEIGLRIRKIRLRLGLSKIDLAQKLGISGQYLGMIENGKGSLSVDKLKILCDTAHVTADYVLFGRDFLLPSEAQKALSKYSSEQIIAAFEIAQELITFMRDM